MPQKISKTQRWLDLISYLVGRRVPVTAAELLERLPAYAAYQNPESAKRVFERDKRELIAHGIPIHPVEYRVSYGMDRVDAYELASGDFFLPYLRLFGELRPPTLKERKTTPGTVEIASEDVREVMEALAALCELPSHPLAPSARTAYAKLALGLDPSLRSGENAVMIAESPEATATAAAVDTLYDALLARSWVSFRYRGAYRGDATDRRVAPYGLLLAGGSWYLIAHDAGRNALREFRVARMEGVTREAASGAYEIPAGFSLRSYQHRQAWELGEEPAQQAQVRFAFPRSLWAERNQHGQRTESFEDGSALHAFEVRQTDSFLRWLLSMEGEAVLQGPREMIEAFRTLARSVAARYRTTAA
ncbi:MAG: WYL domain-containing protein [Gemmatimonadota bacterium]|nr:WYL domain-containing protein [Gemmatimonadota bacterium]